MEHGDLDGTSAARKFFLVLCALSAVNAVGLTIEHGRRKEREVLYRGVVRTRARAKTGGDQSKHQQQRNVNNVKDDANSAVCGSFRVAAWVTGLNHASPTGSTLCMCCQAACRQSGVPVVQHWSLQGAVRFFCGPSLAGSLAWLSHLAVMLLC